MHLRCPHFNLATWWAGYHMTQSVTSVLGGVNRSLDAHHTTSPPTPDHETTDGATEIEGTREAPILFF